MRRALLLAPVWLALAPLVVASPARAETVMQLFGKAQKAASAGHGKIAARILVGILRRYPDHQPSRLLLGHLLFKAGRIGGAAKQFARVGFDLIGPEMAYEYGVTMFTVKDCRRAQAGFSRVPSNSRYASLAYFYRGICYMRTRDWIRANSFLSRVDDLPPNLEPSYRQAYQQVRRMTQAERQGGNSSGGPSTIIIVPVPPPPTYYDNQNAAADDSDAKDKDKAKDKKEKEKKAPPPMGWDTVTTPSLTVSQETDTADNFGFKKYEYQFQTTDLDLSVKTKYTAAARANGGQPYAGLGLDFDDTRMTETGSSSNYIVYSNDTSNVIEQKTSLPAAALQIGSVTATPDADWPLSSVADVDVGYKYQQVFPDLKSDKAFSYQGPSASLNIGRSVTLKLTGSMLQETDNTGKSVETDLTYGADLTKTVDTLTLDLAVQMITQTLATKPAAGPIAYQGPGSTLFPTSSFDGTAQNVSASATKNWDSVSLVATLKDATYTPSSSAYYVDGTYGTGASNLGGSLSLSKTLEIGGNVTATASATQIGGLSVPVDDPNAPPAPTPAPGATPTPTPKVAAKGSGFQYSGLVSFKLAPVDWIFGLVSFSYANTEWSGIDPALVSEVQQATTENATAFKLQLGLTKSF